MGGIYKILFYNIAMSTMKASPFLEEILHLVVLFLKKNGHEAAARKIEK